MAHTGTHKSVVEVLLPPRRCDPKAMAFTGPLAASDVDLVADSFAHKPHGALYAAVVGEERIDLPDSCMRRECTSGGVTVGINFSRKYTGNLVYKVGRIKHGILFALTSGHSVLCVRTCGCPSDARLALSISDGSTSSGRSSSACLVLSRRPRWPLLPRGC